MSSPWFPWKGWLFILSTCYIVRFLVPGLGHSPVVVNVKMQLKMTYYWCNLVPSQRKLRIPSGWIETCSRLAQLQLAVLAQLAKLILACDANLIYLTFILIKSEQTFFFQVYLLKQHPKQSYNTKIRTRSNSKFQVRKVWIHAHQSSFSRVPPPMNSRGRG